MKKHILSIGTKLNHKELKEIMGNGPFTQRCMTDDDCPFCYTCERIHFVKVCVGNC